MKSVISNVERCYLCGSTNALEKHHIFYESNLRKESERYGMWVYLCHQCHQGNGTEIRHNPKKVDDIYLKRIAQREFEEVHGHDEFMRIFHRNWF